MTVQRGGESIRWGRKIGAVLLAVAVLYLVAATAASPTARAALEALQDQGNLAVALLRSQLGFHLEDDVLPAMVSLALSQSPLLSGSREMVLSLQGTEEPDDTIPSEVREDGENGKDPGASGSASESANEPARDPLPVPLPEEPAELELLPQIIDNGVAARTLLPSTTEGYIVSGDVYINNRSDCTFDASLFDGTFAAALSSEEGPQVLILHTHGSEAYTMPPGQAYTPSGECRTTDVAYNVVRVGDVLAEALEAAGVSVIHDSTLHDYPEYSGAYGRSLTTAEEYLAAYPTISVILDVHRDAISDTDGRMYKVVSPVGDTNAAQMSFVIGTDGGGLEHPTWTENLKLAAAVQQRICGQYPTLMRPITVRNSRYNQHLTPGCLLVEIGAAGNSLDEALLSARIFGQALAETLLEK